MSSDFIDDLLNALTRVVTPDPGRLKEVLIISGMPEKTANLRYLAYNSQMLADRNRTVQFSAVAVLNNRRANHWRHGEIPKQISRVIFNRRWTFNPLDLFLNNLRCHGRLMDVIAASPARYTLFGILRTASDARPVDGAPIFDRISPVVAIPELDPAGIDIVKEFEHANEIRKTQIVGLPLYRR